jgi:branched-chain amino acid transport system substrate-binding protein
MKYLVRLTILGLLAALAAAATAAAAPAQKQGSAAQAACAKPKAIKIGATLPLTGPGAPYGALFRISLQIAVDHLNAGGGVNGVPITLKVTDSKALAGPAVILSNQLIRSDKVQVLVSGYNDPPLAQAPIAARAKVLILNGGGNDPALANHPYLWNNTVLISQEAEKVMTYAKTVLGAKKIAILAATDYTEFDINAVHDIANKVFGGDQLLVKFAPTVTDLKPQLQQLAASKPDRIFLLNSGLLTIAAAKAATELNLGIPFLGTSGTLYEPNILQFKSMEGAVADSMTITAAKWYADEFTKQTKLPANPYGGNYADIGYVVANVSKALMAQGKCVTGEEMNNYIKAQTAAGKSIPGANGPVPYTAAGTSGRSLVINKVVGGKIVQQKG